MDPVNPYRPSLAEAPLLERSVESVKAHGRRFAWLWPLLFGVNLITPLMFASAITEDAGWYGVLFASVLFLLGGWLIGRRHKVNGDRLSLGSAVLGITQLMPFLQIIAGVFGFEAAQRLGAAKAPNDQSALGEITTGLGGFICTFVTGGILVVAAFLLGSLLLLFGRLIAKRGRASA